MPRSARSKVVRSVVAAVATSALLSACSSGSNTTNSQPSEGAGPTTVILGDPGKSATLWPEYVADSKHFFADQGLDVKFTATSSSAGVPQEMITGAINVGSAGIVDFVRAISGGGHLHIVAAGVNQPIYGIIAQKDASNWADLKGKRVIVGGPSDITAYYFDTAARANGLDPKALTLVYAGATSARFAALEGGSVSAAMLASPFDANAIAAGGVSLGTVAKYLPNSPFTAYAASDDWAAAHPTALAGFTKAISTAMTWLNDPANKQEAETILMDQTSTDKAGADAAYTSLIDQLKVFPNNAQLSPDALRGLIDGLTKDNFLPSSISSDPSKYIQTPGGK